MRYYVKDKNTIIGMLTVSPTEISYKVFAYALSKLPKLRVYPPGLFKYTIEDGIGVLDTTPPSEETVLDWMKDRIFPEERQNKDFYLELLGFNDYDVISVFLALKGRTPHDTLWVTRFPDEEYTEMVDSSIHSSDLDDELLATLEESLAYTRGELKNAKFFTRM